MRVVECRLEEHAAAMLDILNDAIVNSTAAYDYHPRPADSMVAWFEDKRKQQFPVIGLLAGDELAGFATYGTFRARPAYKYSVEHSVYVHKNHRRRGFGLVLMRAIIDAAREQQYHTLIGGIDVDNAASITLHERLGFVRAGIVRHAGFKFGRWLDLAFYQLLLEGPSEPRDG